MKIEWTRSFKTPAYFLSVLGVFAIWGGSLMLTGGGQESVFACLEGIMYGNGGIFSLMYVVAAVPYATGFCEDMESGYIRYQIMRESFGRYVVQKTVAVFFSSMSAVVIGSFLFFAVLSKICPWFSDIDATQVGWTQFIELKYYAVWFFLYALQWGLWFGTLSVWAALGSVYIPNRLLTWSIPLLLNQFLVEIGFGSPEIYDAGFARQGDRGGKFCLALMLSMVLVWAAMRLIRNKIQKEM